VDAKAGEKRASFGAHVLTRVAAFERGVDSAFDLGDVGRMGSGTFSRGE
jgi:hypothetical protein